MSKKFSKASIKEFAIKTGTSLKRNWNTPNKGEFLTMKEVCAYTVGQTGNFIYSTAQGLIVFASGFFAGAVMGISNLDFYKIGMLGTILGYIMIFMNPLGVLIYENHGVIAKKTRIFAIFCYSMQIIVGIFCYFLPISLMENIPLVGMVGMPQIVGNILVCGGVGNFLSWFVRWKFCAKYGRFKPFYILYAIPNAIIMCIIPFLPVETMPYADKLIILHLAFTFLGMFAAYGAIGNIVQFITPNSNERQRLLSIVPIITSLAPSIIGIFLPMLIQLTGGYSKILTYKVFVPIFAIVGIAVGFFGIKCKERVIEKSKIDDRPKVTFWKGAKNVLKNKYLWITNIGGLFAIWAFAYGGILQFWFVYSLRMEWMWGIASNIVVLSMTLGNLLCPFLIKRFEKKNILIIVRLVSVGTILLMLLSISINSIFIFMFAAFLKNGLMPIETGVSGGLGPDIMDYHQWKYGERCDSMSGVFSWFIGPVTMVLGYILPYLLRVIGFTSDWDMLFNTAVLEKHFTINIIASIVSIVLSVIPFFFYDLTREKHIKCIQELQQQAGILSDNAENSDDPPSGDGTVGGDDEPSDDLEIAPNDAFQPNM